MSKLEKLKASKSLSDIAELLGYKPQGLSFILYQIPEDQKYTIFKIPKKSGGVREIFAPNAKLKEVQKRLAIFLYDCVEELLPYTEHVVGGKNKNQSRKRGNHALAHGFKKGLSIASNAELHKKKKYVLNLDLRNFFPSLNFGRVRGFFIKNNDFQLSPKVATILAQIACHNNELPQGSPCSPVISNLIGRILDVRLARLAKRYKCTYSRYVDDLTFSTNQNSFPKTIAYKRHKKRTNWNIGKELSEYIVSAGFQINPAKTRMQYQDSRQIVTGLTVNKVVNTKSEYYRNARAMCHSLFTKGTFNLPIPVENQKQPKFRKKGHYHYLAEKIFNFFRGFLCKNDRPKSQSTASLEQEKSDTLEGSIDQLQGVLSHIYYIKNYRNKFAQNGFRTSRHDGYHKPKHDTDTPAYPPLNRSNQYADESHQVSVDGIKNLYSKFLFFKFFYFLNEPLIFCEGKTDNIYLKCALKQLASTYPQLIERDNTNLRYRIKFFNRTETTQEMLKLAEGVGGMKFVMLGYQNNVARYRCAGLRHPVIMIVDNDSAGNTLLQAASKHGCNSNQPLNHVTDNLYIIQIPKIDGGKTEMEDYFDEQTLSQTLNGKTFNRTNQSSNGTNQYGKSAFANDVVRRNQNSINFSRFTDVLDLVVQAISSYEELQNSTDQQEES